MGGCKQRGLLASDGSDPSVTDSPEVFALIFQLRSAITLAEPLFQRRRRDSQAYVTKLEKHSPRRAQSRSPVSQHCQAVKIAPSTQVAPLLNVCRVDLKSGGFIMDLESSTWLQSGHPAQVPNEAVTNEKEKKRREHKAGENGGMSITILNSGLSLKTARCHPTSWFCNLGQARTGEAWLSSAKSLDLR